MSIRIKILLGCLSLTLITVLLGLYTRDSAQQLGGLGLKIYDDALMAVSYLRSAQNGFNQLAIHRELQGHEQEIAEATKVILEDLDVARDRAMSEASRHAIEALHGDVAAIGRDLVQGTPPPQLSDEFRRIADGFDILVERYAADAFSYRVKVERRVATSVHNVEIAIVVAVLAAGVITALLSGAIVPPLKAALAIASAIADGKLDNRITVTGDGEPGRLLRMLAQMQEAIAENLRRVEAMRSREAEIQIEHARAEAEQQRRLAAASEQNSAVLAQLGAVGREITGNLKLAAVFRALHAHLRELIGARGLSVFLLDEAEPVLDRSYGIDAGASLPPLRIPLDAQGSLVAEVARARVDRLVESAEGQDDDSMAGLLAGSSTIFGPLMVGDRLLGVLAVQSAPTEIYGERERLIFRTVAAYGAIALANAAAYRDLDKVLIRLQETQEALVVKEKLASLGQLTAGIAHEIQNPLNFVTNFAQISQDLLTELAETLPADADEARELAQMLQGNLDAIRQNGLRAAGIVRNMLLHARGGGGAVERVSINALLSEAVDSTLVASPVREQAAGVALEWHLAQPSPVVEAVPQDLFSVVSNLARNAAYAVGQRRQAAGPDYRPRMTIRSETAGSRVIIRVRDNGIGMSAATMGKVMLPFFTTKPVGEGTGLGLSLSHDLIVKRYRGALDFESVEGEFTEAIVTLPIEAAF